jgi:hypothetical protein
MLKLKLKAPMNAVAFRGVECIVHVYTRIVSAYVVYGERHIYGIEAMEHASEDNWATLQEQSENCDATRKRKRLTNEERLVRRCASMCWVCV